MLKLEHSVRVADVLRAWLCADERSGYVFEAESDGLHMERNRRAARIQTTADTQGTP